MQTRLMHTSIYVYGKSHIQGRRGRHRAVQNRPRGGHAPLRLAAAPWCPRYCGGGPLDNGAQGGIRGAREDDCVAGVVTLIHEQHQRAERRRASGLLKRAEEIGREPRKLRVRSAPWTPPLAKAATHTARTRAQKKTNEDNQTKSGERARARTQR